VFKIFSIIIAGFLIQQSTAVAGPLGTVPTIHDQNLEIMLDSRSDLWTSPYTYKNSPVRISGGSIRIPLFHTETWAASALIYDEALNLGRADFQLGDQSVFIANSLSNQIGGFGVRKNFSDGGEMSVFAAYATASDSPWGAPRNNYFYGALIYRTKKFNDHSYLLGIDQSGNRGLYNGKPFPYFGMTFELEGKTVSFGFPYVKVDWTFKDDWHGQFFTTPFGTNLRVSTDVGDNTTVGAFTAFTVRSYLLDARIDDNDRLYYQEIMAEAYLTRDVTSTTQVTFAVGGSGDRRIYQTDRLYHPDAKTQTIKGDFYGRLAVEFRL
jgi:hypothetical protein